MSFLASLTGEARAELDALIDARIAAALGARDRTPAKRWLTTAEAGEYLGCSVRAIYRRLDRNRIPRSATKHQGRRLLIDRQALDAALEKGL